MSIRERAYWIGCQLGPMRSAVALAHLIRVAYFRASAHAWFSRPTPDAPA